MDILKEKLNRFETDYRAEVIAASLIEEGINLEDLEIVRAGTSRRGFSKEVEKIYRKYSAYDLCDYLCIEANKEGIYDMLPQGVFHQPLRRNTVRKYKEDILEEIRIHRGEEFFARKFFHVFELLTDRVLTEACLFEARYDRKTSYPEFTDLFTRYWPILKMLSLKQSVFFMHIIPLLHRIRLHYKNMEQAFSCVLEVPVTISPVKLPAKKSHGSCESSIGESRIGVDCVLGKQFDDGVYDLKLTLGPLSAVAMKHFIEPAEGYQILDRLCEIFLPAHAFIVKEYVIDPQDAVFTLSDEKNATFLGINSFTNK